MKPTLEEQKKQVAVYLGCDCSNFSRYELSVFMKHIEDDKKNGTIQGLSPEVYHTMIRNRSVPLEERLKVLDVETCKIISGYLERGIKAMKVPNLLCKVPKVENDSSCW